MDHSHSAGEAEDSMKKTYASIIIWGAMAVTCIVLLFSQNVYADEPIEGIYGGPGVCYDEEGEVVAVDFEDEDIISDVPAELSEAEDAGDQKDLSEISEASQEAVLAAENEATEDESTFLLDGTEYKKGDFLGSRRLTGYSGEQWGTDTASGQAAKAGYTVSATSQLPFGTVLIIDGGSGPAANVYDGIYVVQDRGGAAIESGEIIDIFFDTHAEAMAVTDLGWTYADIWIAVPA